MMCGRQSPTLGLTPRNTGVSVKSLWSATRPRPCARHLSPPTMVLPTGSIGLTSLIMAIKMAGMDPATFLCPILVHLATPVYQTLDTAAPAAVITFKGVQRSSAALISSDATMTVCGKMIEGKQTIQITARMFGLADTLFQLQNATTAVKPLIRSVTRIATRGTKGIISALWRPPTQWIVLPMVRLILVWIATRVVALVKVS